MLFAHGAGGEIADCCGFGRRTYHSDCMYELARDGYLTVTYSLRGLGTDDFGRPEWEPMDYTDLVRYALNRGSSAMAVWVYDGLQVLDAMLRHPAVDPARICFAGMSHGGQIAMYAGAIAPERIAAVIAMGSMISFETIYTEVHNMAGHAVPGIARYGNMGDYGALVAPRPLFVQWGEHERDDRAGQLRDSSLAEFARTQGVYARLGAAAEAVARVTPDEGHHFDLEAARTFLAVHLR
ncbi:MAG: alpha/beta fold hydrolase [Planctomycetota bacterium]